MIITWSVIAKACAGVIAIGTALGFINKGVVFSRKPFETLNTKIDNMKLIDETNISRLQDDSERLDKHDKMLEMLKNDNEVIMNSMLLLMSHAETGNNTGEIANGRKKVEAYLVKRRG